MRLSPVPLLMLAWSTASFAQQAPVGSVNRLIGIRLAQDGSVEVSCLRQPNFTTASLNGPPRLVVDFADTVLGDPPHETAVHHHGLAKVATSSFTSDTGALARVVFTLEPESDADIEPMEGNRIRVRFSERTAVAVADVAVDTAPAGHSLDADVDDLKAREESVRRAQAAAEDAQRERARAIASAQAKEEAEAHAKAAAEAQAAAEAKATAAQQAKLKAETDSRLASQAEAEAEAKAQADAAAKLHAEQEAQALQKAKADSDARTEAERVARASAEAKAKAMEERIAELEAQRNREAQARETAEAQARTDAAARVKAESDAKAAEEARTVAEAERARQAAASRADHVEVEASEQRAREAEAQAEKAKELAATEAAQADEARRAVVAQRQLDQQRLQSTRASAQPLPLGPDTVVRTSAESPSTRVATALDNTGSARPQSNGPQSSPAAEARMQAELAERDRLAQLDLQKSERAAAEARAEDSLTREQAAAERAAQVAKAGALPARVTGKKEVRVASAGGPERVAGRTGLRDITLVGFKETAAGGRAFIKVSEVPRYRVSELDPTTLLVELPDARISQHNNALPLDTSFFPGAVALISPVEDRRNHMVRVEIKLKESVPYDARVEGTDLVIDFRSLPTP